MLEPVERGEPAERRRADEFQTRRNADTSPAAVTASTARAATPTNAVRDARVRDDPVHAGAECVSLEFRQSLQALPGEPTIVSQPQRSETGTYAQSQLRKGSKQALRLSFAHTSPWQRHCRCT